MEILNLLNKAIQERYFASTAIEALESRIQESAEMYVMELYSSKRLIRGELEFELIGVRAMYWNPSDNITYTEKIRLTLYYICVSKLPKDKQLRVEETRKLYKKDRHFGWNSFKIPLWHELKYECYLEDVLKKDIHLKID